MAVEPWGKDGRPRLRLYVGRALWYAIGSPARMDAQRVGGRLELRAAAGDAGLAFQAGKGMPRAFCDGWADVLRLEPGRYAAEVVGGAIVVTIAAFVPLAARSGRRGTPTSALGKAADRRLSEHSAGD